MNHPKNHKRTKGHVLKLGNPGAYYRWGAFMVLVRLPTCCEGANPKANMET